MKQEQVSILHPNKREMNFLIFKLKSEARFQLQEDLQDPLSELVKIDPGSVGVGQYQHDVCEKETS